jgi:NAD+ synthetase
MFGSHCAHHGVPLLYTNAVGGNDELVFDGQAFVIDARGSILASGVPFEEEILLVEVTAGSPTSVTPLASLPLAGGGGAGKAMVHEPLERVEAVRRALVLGLRDYAAKCGFDSVVLGLSGGIDSSLVAVLAAEALGPERVHGLAIPSRYSSPESVEDARDLARNLGTRFDVVSLEPSFEAMLQTMQPLFGDRPPDIAEENLQARLRGMILMGMANKFGHLLLSTGNKSELAVGYCTLYGDMAGGLAVISDVPKGLVYALSRHLNRGGERIPERVLTKPPSAELRPDQKDEDSLPPYEVLDAILEGHIEDRRGERELVESGLPADTVRRVVEMVARAEYKRRQAAPGIRISPKAFGPGRRMPIATGWPPPGTGTADAG